MSLRRFQDALTWAALAVAALYVGLALFGEAGLYTTALRPGVLLRLAAVAKLGLLILAAVHAHRTTSLMEAGNPARVPWRMFALAMASFALGQSVLSFGQIRTGVSPFPSVGDVFFVAAYPLMIASFLAFIRTYREAGYPVGTAGQHTLIAAFVAVLAGVIAVPILRPVVAAGGTPVELFLNVAYPTFDFVLLVPMIILIRVAWPFRGGAIFRAWAAILGGVVAFCAADLLFAWFSMLGEVHLDPLLHSAYLVGYACLAWGTRSHRELVAA